MIFLINWLQGNFPGEIMRKFISFQVTKYLYLINFHKIDKKLHHIKIWQSNRMMCNLALRVFFSRYVWYFLSCLIRCVHCVLTAINDILSWVCASKRTFYAQKIGVICKNCKTILQQKVQKTIRRCGGGPFQGRRKVWKSGGEGTQ